MSVCMCARACVCFLGICVLTLFSFIFLLPLTSFAFSLIPYICLLLYIH